jgi:hypothetical protein
VTDPGAVGGGFGGDAFDAGETPLTARAEALRRLRALHAEQHILELRVIEVRVALASRRRQLDEVEAAGRSRIQGPLESRVFEQAVAAVADLQRQRHRIEQRLIELAVEIPRAVGAAVRAVAVR